MSIKYAPVNFGPSKSYMPQYGGNESPEMFNQTGSFSPSSMMYGNTPNQMDLMSDGYTNSGVPNMAGLSYGQSLSGGRATTPEGLFSSLGKWASDSGFTPTKDAAGITTGGWGAPAIQGISGLMNGFMAMKQYGLSKDIFENNKQQFERNFGAQKGITNSQLSDRQDRRNADARANGMTGTTSTADYMSKWGVK